MAKSNTDLDYMLSTWNLLLMGILHMSFATLPSTGQQRKPAVLYQASLQQHIHVSFDLLVYCNNDANVCICMGLPYVCNLKKAQNTYSQSTFHSTLSANNVNNDI